MSAFNASFCVDGHFSRVIKVNGNDFCICYTQYKGEYCEIAHDFYRPFIYAMTAMRFLTMGYVLLWAILKVVQLVKSGAFRIKKLSVVSLLLVLFGTLIRLVYDAIYIGHPNSVSGTQNLERAAPAVSALLNALVTLSIVFYMASTSLILGFWFDVLQKKLRPTIAARTKIACIVGAALVLIAIPGLIIQIRAILPPLGAVLVLAPLIINIVGMIVLLITIACMRGSLKKLAEANRRKQQYAIKVISVSVVFWVFYLISVGLYAPAVAMNPKDKETAGYYVIPAMTIDMISEFVIPMCILFLVDRHGGLLRQIKFLFCGVLFLNSSTNRGSMTTTSSSKLGSEDSTNTSSRNGKTQANSIPSTSSGSSTATASKESS